MTAVPYFLLLLPLIELAMSNPDAGDLLLLAAIIMLGWKNRWLR